VFGDSSTGAATQVVSKAARTAPDAVSKVAKIAAQSPESLLKSAKLAAQSDAARLAPEKLAKGLAANADAATKAAKVAPEGFTNLGKGLAASGLTEGVAAKAGLFAETTGKLAPKAGALSESTATLASKLSAVADSGAAKAAIGAAEGAGLAAGVTGITVAGAEYMKQNLGLVLGVGALLGLAKWSGDALTQTKDGSKK
jgi:hypothetical protein